MNLNFLNVKFLNINHLVVEKNKLKQSQVMAIQEKYFDLIIAQFGKSDYFWKSLWWDVINKWYHETTCLLKCLNYDIQNNSKSQIGTVLFYL